MQEGRSVVGRGGSTLMVDMDNKPSLYDSNSMSQSLFTLAPCGLNVPHLHPRAGKVVHVLRGTPHSKSNPPMHIHRQPEELRASEVVQCTFNMLKRLHEGSVCLNCFHSYFVYLPLYVSYNDKQYTALKSETHITTDSLQVTAVVGNGMKVLCRNSIL